MIPMRTIAEQLDVLENAGVLALAHNNKADVRTAVAALRAEGSEGLVALHQRWFAASELAPLLTLNGKKGFVVGDMTDVDEFTPAGINLPDAPLYLVRGVRRGDDLHNVSPQEALVQFEASHRRPLTLQEGLSWALSTPAIIEANSCFMTIGSRKVKRIQRSGEVVYDSRTPALWISSGTGRDGRERRGAPKLGWCWWRNRHTWLGIASAYA
ncbi:DUF5701 family protein [Bifidobacterium aquikefiri]|uniref:DUF5701 family protein n=1 Tax=Bifidobacterium aquikefiri TaxID=1653207 RepID=UPI0039E87714